MEQAVAEKKSAALSTKKELRLLGINEVAISGRLTKVPLIRRSKSGYQFMHFTLAMNRRCKVKSSNGTWRQTVDYVPVVLKGKTFSAYAKGTPVFVQGALKSERWSSANRSSRSALRVNATKVRSFAKQQTINGL